MAFQNFRANQVFLEVFRLKWSVQDCQVVFHQLSALFFNNDGSQLGSGVVVPKPSYFSMMATLWASILA